jgi:hypothetical protein
MLQGFQVSVIIMFKEGGEMIKGYLRIYPLSYLISVRSYFRYWCIDVKMQPNLDHIVLQLYKFGELYEFAWEIIMFLGISVHN